METATLSQAQRKAVRKAVRPEPVTLSPIESPSDEILVMIVEASFDPDIRAKNYLPACMDIARAREYCATTEAVVLRLGGKAVGVAALLPNPSPGEGVEIPRGGVELDMWVLPAHRGQGMRWFPLIKVWAAQLHDYVLGVTWATNDTAIALLKWSGWQHLGTSFWSAEGASGYCEVFIYDLRPHRTLAA